MFPCLYRYIHSCYAFLFLSAVNKSIMENKLAGLYSLAILSNQQQFFRFRFLILFRVSCFLRKL